MSALMRAWAAGIALRPHSRRCSHLDSLNTLTYAPKNSSREELDPSCLGPQRRKLPLFLHVQQSTAGVLERLDGEKLLGSHEIGLHGICLKVSQQLGHENPIEGHCRQRERLLVDGEISKTSCDSCRSVNNVQGVCSESRCFRCPQ